MKADIRLTSVAVVAAWVVMTWLPGWPSAVVCIAALAADVVASRFQSERRKEFDALRADLATATTKHREELERLHANLEEVGAKVRAIGNVQTMRGVR